MAETKDRDLGKFRAVGELERMGCKFHWFKNGKYKIPEISDTSAFDEARKGNALEILTTLESYINAPATEDRFKSHPKRRIWRDKLAPELADIYKKNRLRVGEISGVILGLELLGDYLKPEDTRKGQIKAIAEQVRVTMPPKNKNIPLTYADFVAASIIDVLRLLADY